jgi:hypothetical protein
MGDGKTRLDVPSWVEHAAVRRFLNDAEFHHRVQVALRTLDGLGVQRTVEIEKTAIITAFIAQWVFR